MTRRVELLLAVLLTTILLASCGAEEQAKEKAAPPETTAETTSETTVPETTAETTAQAVAPAAPTEEDDDQDSYDATVTVTRVVDGDTVEISPAIGGITDLRFIGVDTPETKEPGCAPQPYGQEASDFTRAQLSGQQVGLEFDVEKTDRYGRLLAYVYPQDGEMFNETLLEEGYAQVATFPPNVRYADHFLEAQHAARETGRGLWGLSPEELAQQTDRGNGIGGTGCPPLTPPPPPPPEPQPIPEFVPEPSPKAPALPKGDVDCGDFATRAEAQAYLLPGDPHRLDRDGDGQACDSLP